MVKTRSISAVSLRICDLSLCPSLPLLRAPSKAALRPMMHSKHAPYPSHFIQLSPPTRAWLMCEAVTEWGARARDFVCRALYRAFSLVPLYLAVIARSKRKPIISLPVYLRYGRTHPQQAGTRPRASAASAQRSAPGSLPPRLFHPARKGSASPIGSRAGHSGCRRRVLRESPRRRRRLRA